MSAQSEPPAVQQNNPQNNPPAPATPGSQASQPNPQTLGIISGTVTDREGALAVGAKVSLFVDGLITSRDVMSGNNGEFSFADVPAGPFHLRVTAPGFDTQQYWGQIQPGQALLVPPIKLPVTGGVTEVNVGGSPEEIAQIEVKQELQQRVFGFIPNFYVTYTTDPPPLFAKQKFNLAWKSVIDPVTIAGVAFLAGVYQASDTPGGYGQGAEGYGRRFGAAYGDVVFGTFIGSAILPSVLHQDPRYFYLGPDYSMKKRWEHALANSVIARNDRSKKWEPNYSGIIGSFAAAGISYTYLPASDRTTGLYLEDALVRLGESSVAGILQEFILRKFTSHVPKQSAVSP
ncbi:MAG TPA: carboxypeptidase-like regulatory domain-containing protein [Bryocella sp.]|nr:carboxypeptidase-like regulatory domain-containing protein [Bryocella sp.]